MTDQADDDDRVAFDDLTEEQLDGIYDELDQYEEVLGDVNETVISLIRQLAHARYLHETNCPVAQRMVPSSYPCAMCKALTDPRDQT